MLPVCGEAAVAQTPASASALERGEYLARAANCIGCHTVEGGKPYAGGVAFKLPFGILYAPNITPDRESGIGSWSDEDFVKAMHEGIAKDGKHLYPAFPYTSYTMMPRRDVLAIKAYLFSQPAVRQSSPAHTLSFPFNQRYLMAPWNRIFNPNQRIVADPARSVEWNRGRYLVESLGHCGECHTPRNLLQARKSSRHLAGATTQGWKAYNITSDPVSGIGAWSEQALIDYFSTGHAQGHSTASGPMAEVVNNSLRFLTSADLRAMANYLKTVAPLSDTHAPPIAVKPLTVSPSSDGDGGDRLGQKMYAQACAACHRWDGTGAQTSHADLLGTRAVNDVEPTNLLQVVLQGSHLDTVYGRIAMPGFAHAYSDTEIAAVANYVRRRFGARASELKAQDVQTLRE